MSDGDPRLTAIRRSALAFVQVEAGFAQLTTLDHRGYPVTRTMTAFLARDWSVATVQRRSHRRLAQWRRDPRTEVTWVASPAPDATNERPHVFDIGQLPPRLVSIRGNAEQMSDEWTADVYFAQLNQQRRAGHTRAPVRSPDGVRAELVGVQIRPIRIRLEGFGVGAEPFGFTPTPNGDLR